MLAAGAVDVLQPDATRCGDLTGFLEAGTLLPRAGELVPDRGSARGTESSCAGRSSSRTRFRGKVSVSGGWTRMPPKDWSGDVHGLAAALASAHRGRGALRRRQPRALRHRRLELPPGSHRGGGAADGRGRGGDGRRLPAAWRARPGPRRRNQPGRPVLQRGRGHRHFQAPQPRAGGGSRAQTRARGAGRGARRPAPGRRTPPPDLRTRSRHPPPVHPGRDDRQQLVRRALGDGGPHRGQRRGARGPDL